ncbi:tetratricopeptide repeat protein [bacterium]|nr:tetratricopeptide repeat protein [bacterium]
MAKKGHKECPVCFEEIKAKALVCRFCGAVLSDQPLPQMLPRDLAESIEKTRENQGEALTGGAPARLGKSAPSSPIPRPLTEKGVPRQSRPLPKEQPPEGLDSLERTPKEDINAAIDAHFSETHAEVGANQRHLLQEFLERSEDQYRTASVLFIDICGYTSLSERLRAEYVKEMLDAFYAICTQEVDQHNGIVVDFSGDACLAVFGAPVAYDRDVEACVRVALAIREKVRLFPPIEGTRIQVSGGIATGEILSSFVEVEGRRDFSIFGATVNLAARIEAAAKDDTILVCPDTREQVKGIFDFRKKRPRKFKNVGRPVTTYEVLGEKTEGIQRRDFSIPFVGREKEREKMRSAWEGFRVAPAKRGQMQRMTPRSPFGIRVCGGPGIGKTRIVQEFLNALTEEYRCLHCESGPQDRRVPFGAWRTALAGLWKGRTGDPLEKTQRELDRLLDALQLPRAMIGLKAMFGLPEALHDGASLGPTALKRLLQAEVRSLLGALARERPLILHFDDLQWTDPSSIEMLEALASPPTVSDVFLIIGHRLEFRRAGPGLRSLPQIRLRRLEEESRNALLGRLASLEELGPEIREALSAQATGNPLFLVEMLRNVMARLAEAKTKIPECELAQQIRKWVPGNLRGLLQSRIDLLDQRGKITLQCGAVLGQRFTYQLMELFDIIREGLMARLYALKGLEFLDDVKSTDELEFLFRHPLMRETAYETLLERQRREFHRTVAERLEKTLKSRLPDYYPVLAYHYEMCGDGSKAIEYLHLAGDRAFEQAATLEAIEFYESALEHLSKGGEPDENDLERAGRILRRKGILHRLAGENGESIACFERGRNMRFSRANRTRDAEFAAETGITLLKQSDYKEGRRELESALQITRNLKAPDLRGQILNALGTCAWEQGKLTEARKFFDRTLRTRVTKDHQAIHADARNNLALLEWRRGRLEYAGEGFKAALQMYQRIGQTFGVALVLMNLGIIEENTGRFGQARRFYLRSLECAERVHFIQLQCAVQANLGNLALVRKRFVEAMDHNARALEIACAIGDRRLEAIALENLSLGQIGLRQYQEAKNSLGEARRIARKINNAERKISLDLVEIELQLAQWNGGKRPRSFVRIETVLCNAQKEIVRTDCPANLPRLWRLRVAVCLRAGRTAEAREMAQQALAECENQKNRSEEKRIKALLQQIGKSE